MKILVLSDSHSSLRSMRLAMDTLKPDAVIHLGDYVSDGEAIASDYPGVPFYQVAGNCDRYRVAPDYPEIRVENIGGIRIFVTHGHLQGVKRYTDKLEMDALRCNAQIALYGHTHEPDCRLEPDGLWVLNPGTCGYAGGTFGWIEIGADRSVSCRVIRQSDLEAFA